MSYDDKLIKTSSKKLSMATFPGFVKFYAKHRQTPQSYIAKQNERLRDQYIHADVKAFLQQEPVLGRRKMLSMPDKSGRLPEPKTTQTVKYFNQDLQRYVTAEVPMHMKITHPEIDEIIDSYGDSSQRGGAKTSKQKTPKQKTPKTKSTKKSIVKSVKPKRSNKQKSIVKQKRRSSVVKAKRLPKSKQVSIKRGGAWGKK